LNFGISGEKQLLILVILPIVPYIQYSYKSAAPQTEALEVVLMGGIVCQLLNKNIINTVKLFNLQFDRNAKYVNNSF
jgi:hypothetical protein